jgi:site-specific DNA-methyltransferase (adenine-specific)
MKQPPRNHIIIGDALAELQKLPDSCIDTVITSPPYFGLRDYGHEQQLGLESDVYTWAERVRMVCRQLARVLKPTGSLWLNLGDSFSCHARQGTPFKCLLLGPQRVALKLLGDGWMIRNQVIWAKPNGMPSSVRDRLSCKYEVLLLLVRTRHYFFDLDAIRVAAVSPRQAGKALNQPYPPLHAQPPKAHGINKNFGLRNLKASGRPAHPLGKNPGDVWTIPTTGFHDAHFATFPLKLVERPLRATCPERVCATCGAPWRRQPINRQDASPRLGALQPGCGCNGLTTPGLVLDPFMGSGTVALAAERLGRDWLGVELNRGYAAITRRRLRAERRGARGTMPGKGAS